MVIGAGVAGPVAAVALQRAGFTTTVYEARDAAADELGAWLTLQVNGVDALRTLGIGHVADGLGFATPSIRFRSGSGKHLGNVGTGAALPDGTVGLTLRRSELYRALPRRGAAGAGSSRCALLPVFLRRQGAQAAAWLHGHHIDWDTPVTEPASAVRSQGVEPASDRA